MALEYYSGNRLCLLNSGQAYFPALLSAIDEARAEIYLESYIFAADAIGQRVAQALSAAAARGVAVHVLVDGFGARHFERDFPPSLLSSGVQVLHFRRELAIFRLRRHRLRRLHRKLVVIDGRIGFVGGINIVDDQNEQPELGPRFDYAVRVEGPLLQALHRAVRQQWEVVSWASLQKRFGRPPGLTPDAMPVGEQRAAFVVRDNLRHRNDIANAYLEAIQSAREEVLIANAYFLPGFRFRHALFSAVQRGVRVTVLLQGPTDHPLFHLATQALYAALIRQGVRVFEYRQGFMHAKVAVVDREWATVGSSNIDPFSLLLAKEANIVALDKRFAGELKSSLLSALHDGAVELKEEDMRRLPWHVRLRSWISYELVRLLVGFTGYGPKDWRADEDQPEELRPGSRVGAESPKNPNA